MAEAMSARRTSLRRVNAQNADLEEADLRGADLEGADLRSANLRGANLTGASLRGADLRGACLDDAILAGAQLCGARFSADVENQEPSHPKTTVLDAALEPTEGAQEPFGTARPMAERPMSELGLRRGASPVGDEKHHTFRKEGGDYWYLCFGEEEARMRDRKGFTYIHTLILNEGRWVSAAELLALTDPDAVSQEEQKAQQVRRDLLDAQADAHASIRYVRSHRGSSPAGSDLDATAFYVEELTRARDQMKKLNKNLYARLANSLQRAYEALDQSVPTCVAHLRRHVSYRSGEWLYLQSGERKTRWELF